MDADSTTSIRRPLGHVEIIELPDQEIRSRDGELIAKRFLYTLRPPDQLLSELPSWYALALECTVANDGTRRFAPVDLSHIDLSLHTPGLGYVSTTSGLALVASLGGHAILADRGEIEDNQLLSYHEAHLLFQYVQHRREYLGGTRQLAGAIRICAGARADRSVKDILPEDLGTGRDGSGKRWTFSDVRTEGKAAAQAAGITNPNPEQILRFGLMEAAKVCPIQADELDVEGIVRLSLFGLGSSSEPVSPAELAYVALHVRQSLSDHLSDSVEDFRLWIADPGSNLRHRISKRRDCPMSQAQVRKCILELGWLSFKLMAKCIDAQMRVFRDAISEVFTSKESAFYEQIYQANPTFGGIPMVLLAARIDFLGEALVNLWNRPDDPDAVPILHTMMYYYAILAGHRREADRLYKRRSQNLGIGQGAVREETPRDDDEFVKSNVSDQQLFCETARRVAENEGYPCDFEGHEFDARLEHFDLERVAFGLICPALGFDEVIEVGRSDFDATANEVRDENERAPRF